MGTLTGCVVPSEFTDIDLGTFAEFGGKHGVVEHGEDAVGDLFGVPEVDFECVVNYFGDAGSFGDDDGNILPHGFECSNAERLGDRGHDVDVGELIDFLDIVTAKEASEENLVSDAFFSCEADDFAHFVTTTGHDEFYIVPLTEDFFGSLDEVLGTFLHGDAAEEEDNAIVFGDGLGAFRLEWCDDTVVDAVVNNVDFFCGDVVAVNEDRFGEMRNSDDACGGLHAITLDGVDGLVDVFTGTIELGGVDMGDEGDAEQLCDLRACRVGEPVVSMDDVVVAGASEVAAESGVSFGGTEQVAGVFDVRAGLEGLNFAVGAK